MSFIIKSTLNEIILHIQLTGPDMGEAPKTTLCKACAQCLAEPSFSQWNMADLHQEEEGHLQKLPVILLSSSLRWRSLGLNCRLLTFWPHLAGDHGAKLNWFPLLQNIWSTSHASATGALQTRCHGFGALLKSWLTASATAALSWELKCPTKLAEEHLQRH